MITPLFSEADIFSGLDKLEKDTEERIVEILRYAGEYFIKLARESGEYKDQTGNLRSSIFYMIIKNGRVLYRNVAKARQGDAKKETQELLYKLPGEYPEGILLIGGAGMKYAASVEGVHSLDVVTGASIKLEKFLKESLKEAFENG